MSKLSTWFLFVMFFAIVNLSAQNMTIEKVRDQFFSLDKQKDGALKIFKSMEKADLSKEPVLLAYRGASCAASAGSLTGVWKKLEYFNHGKSELEKAVGMKPLDAEIRFLRLATQVNAPAFLGYTGDKKADKAIIMQVLNGVNSNHPNAYLYLRICRFMLAHTELSASEKNTVNQQIVKFDTKK